MARDFAKAVEDGLKLSKRIYFGKDRAVAPRKPPMMMNMSVESHLPTAPMVYAVINDPGIVDNPDIPSYQPHVHGRLDPPALIPLQMNRVELVVDCYLNTAFVRLTGSWRVHCVMGSRSCDCRIAIRWASRCVLGTILGVEVDIPRKSYHTQLLAVEDNTDTEKTIREDGGFLNPYIFTLTVPEVDGGTNLSIQIKWSQKFSFSDGRLCLNVPFTFPELVTPAGKKVSKKENIRLNVNAGTCAKASCNTISHPLKELRRQAGRLSYLYEAEVLSWSKMDFSFSYSVQVLSAHVHGGVFLQSPSVHDSDQREIFSIYLYSGKEQSKKVFRKEIVYVVDISGGMRGKILKDIKNALFEALTDLDSEDSFNIIAFNCKTYLFSMSMVIATKEAIARAIEWIGMNFVAEAGTNTLLPLTKAIEMLSNADGSFPLVFLITDGSVEDERHICDVMKKKLAESGSISSRINGIDSIGLGLKEFITKASSPLLANINMDTLNDLEEVEVYPSTIPDLSRESLLIVSGRYQGKFPPIVEAGGLLPNLSNFKINLKVQQAKDVPLDQIIATEHIAQLTAQAWFSGNKQLKEKIAKMSMHTGVVCEYTRMATLEVNRSTEVEKEMLNKRKNQEMVEPKDRTITMLKHLGIGFGDLIATAENAVPGVEEARLPEAAEILVKAASSGCSRLCSHCCCPCCIEVCFQMNNQCAIALAQLCTALACFGCLDCCFNLCCSTDEGT